MLRKIKWRGKTQDRNKAGKVLLDADTLGPHRKASKTREVAPGNWDPCSLLWRLWRECHSHPPLASVHWYRLQHSIKSVMLQKGCLFQFHAQHTRRDLPALMVRPWELHQVSMFRPPVSLLPTGKCPWEGEFFPLPLLPVCIVHPLQATGWLFMEHTQGICQQSTWNMGGVVTTMLVLFRLTSVYGILRVQARGFRMSWLIVCLNLTGLRAAQSIGKILFLGVSVRTVSLEGICTWTRRLNEDRPHHRGWNVIFFTFTFPGKPGLVLSIGELLTDVG